MNPVFFILYPDPPATDRACEHMASAWRRSPTGRRAARERLHISLNNIGGWAEPDEQAIAKAKEIASRTVLPSFVVALDHLVAWKGGTVVLTSDEGLIGVFNLYDALNNALADAGMSRRRDWAFSPHLTLIHHSAAEIDEFIAPVSWRVREFRLIRSIDGAGRHEPLGRWPLAE